MSAAVGVSRTGTAVDPVLVAALRRSRAAGRRRTALVCTLLTVAALLLVGASVLLGTRVVAPSAAVAAIVGAGDPTTVYVVQSLRLPRAVTGLVVGLALGASGAIFQSLARNPLASPDIIGITIGASLAAVVALLTVGPLTLALTVGALAGAAAAALLILVLSLGHGMPPLRLVLVGIGIQAVLAATIDFLLTRADPDELAQATLWLAGSLNGRGWNHAAGAAVALLVLTPAALALVRPMRGLSTGAEVAAGLGVPVGRVRVAAVLVGCGLAGGAVAAAGPVALVAFLGPPLARRLVRSPGPALVPSALFSAVLLLSADLAGQHIAPTPIPVGLTTALIGAPYLLWTLRRTAARAH